MPNVGPEILDPTTFYPNQEDLQIYVELVAIRKSKSVLNVNFDSNEEILFARAGTKVNLIGLNSDTNSFTTNWTNYDAGNPELFGIKSIDIKIQRNYITSVNISFIDVRGVAITNVRNSADRSPYAILFDFPLAEFRLRFKGQYGRVNTINLTITRPPSISLENGDYRVDATFTSKTFGPLADIRTAYILAAPYMEEYLAGDTTSTSQESQSISNPSNITLLKLIEEAERVPKLIQEIEDNDPDGVRYKEIDEKFQIVEQLKSDYLSIERFANQSGFVVNRKENNLEFGTNSAQQNSQTNQPLLSQLTSYINSFRQANLNINPIPRIGVTSDIIDESTNSKIAGLIAFGMGSQHLQALDDKARQFESERNQIADVLDKRIDDSVTQSLGFKPTLRNIVNVLTSGADTFIRLLKETMIRAEEYHLAQGATDEDGNPIRFAFPDYIVQETNSDLDTTDANNTNPQSTTTSVRKYPGIDENNAREWPECQFVEAYLNAITTELDFLEGIETRYDTNADRFANFTIPSSPTDNRFKFDLAIDADEVFSSIIERYYVASNFSYFNVSGSSLSLFNKFLYKAEAYNLNLALKRSRIGEIVAGYFQRGGEDILTVLNDSVNLPNTAALLNNPDLANIGNIAKRTNAINFKKIDIQISSNNDGFTFQNLSSSAPTELKNILNITTNTPWIKKSLVSGSTINSNLNTQQEQNPSSSISIDSDGFLSYYDPKFNSISNNNYEHELAAKIGTEFVSKLPFTDEEISFYRSSASEIDKITVLLEKLFKNFDDTPLKKYVRIPSVWYVPIGFLVKLRNRTDIFFADDIVQIEEEYNNFVNRYGGFIVGLLENDVFDESGNLDEPILVTIFTTIGALIKITNYTSVLNGEQITTLVGNANLNSFLQNLGTEFLSIRPARDISRTTTDVSVPTSPVNSINVRQDLYYAFKEFADRWMTGDEDLFGGQSLISLFRFIDRASRPIGNKMVVDFISMTRSINSQGGNRSLYSSLGDLFDRNNLIFFPYDNFLAYDGQNGVGESRWTLDYIFRPTLSVAEPGTPLYTVMFAGGPSQRLGVTKDNVNQDDSFQMCDTADAPADFRQGNAKAFVVKFNTENQAMFNQFSISTEQFKNTYESFMITDNLAKQQNIATASRVGQSMLNIYLNAAYNVTVGGLGNAMIQPLMYFCLKGMGLFDGTYLILEVSHSITDNTMKTTFTGTRMPRATIPIVQEFAINYRRAYGERRRTQIPRNSATNRVPAPNPVASLDYTSCVEAGGVSPETLVSEIIANEPKMQALLNAIFRVEGNFKGAPAFDQNNPGNISNGSFAQQFSGRQGSGSTQRQRFYFFNTLGSAATSKVNGVYEDSGFGALRKLIETLTPNCASNTRRVAYSQMSLDEFFRCYAPAGDGANEPAKYAVNAANFINSSLGIRCTPTTRTTEGSAGNLGSVPLNPAVTFNPNDIYSVSSFFNTRNLQIEVS